MTIHSGKRAFMRKRPTEERNLTVEDTLPLLPNRDMWSL